MRVVSGTWGNGEDLDKESENKSLGRFKGEQHKKRVQPKLGEGAQQHTFIKQILLIMFNKTYRKKAHRNR